MLKLVTKHNQNAVVDKAGLILHYEFTLYRLTMNFYVPPFRSNYGLLQGVAKIDAYGIIVRMALEQDGLLIIEESDKGPLSAQQFEVSGLLSILCQMEAPSIQKVNEEISRAQLLWSANKWGHHWKNSGTSLPG
ncbi:hypothetical protein [Paenibacillus validus]|uniref:hypothetical protein n=1 Tax=Paenibacillus validus TaxID=44253 RepID=UPI003D2A8302